jgi:isocitrate dehydrogenase (NAD+)
LSTGTRPPRVALVVGEGVGTEVMPHALRVLEAAGASIEWLRVDVPRVTDETAPSLLDAAVEAVRECGIGLKTRLLGPGGMGAGTEAAVLRGPRNPNVELRQRLGLFAGIRPIRSFAGLPTRYPGLDLVLIRENTEDVYRGIEHEITAGVVQSLKVVTRTACDRVTRFAFDYAAQNGRKRITFVHKANIMKRSDGLFLDVFRRIAAEHPEIETRESIVDACCMQLVLDPYKFDLILTGNLYGDILSSLGFGLAGGISAGLSINVGDDCRVFEAVHGDAPQILGAGTANPLPLLRPAVALLRHLGQEAAAQRIRAAVSQVLEERATLTPDLGGQATTSAMCDALIGAITADRA